MAAPRKTITPEEAVRRIEKQREYRREYARRPESREKQRNYKKKRTREIFAGYLAAKKAGLI